MDSITHNMGSESTEIVVEAANLPRIIALKLSDGSIKRYSLSFARKAEGLILNKAI